MSRYLITKEGFTALEKELARIKIVLRPKIIKSISDAREHGDLKENAEYHAAKEQQAMAESKISELEGIKEHVEIIDVSLITSDDVRFGATVGLLEEDEEKKYTYKIVSPYEADVENEKIGLSSPLAKAILGKKKGDYVEFTTQRGTRNFKILSVKYV
jgi:transcription elongation factor GreA